MKKIFIAFWACVAGTVFASKPLLQGEIYVADFSEHVSLQSYRVIGQYHDYSMVGFVGNEIAVSNLVFTEDDQGNCDAWRITNIVAAGVVNITVDVVYAESGSSTVGMVSGYAGLCSLSTNSVGFPQVPSSEFCHLSANLLNQIRNWTFQQIPEGGTGSITNWPTPAEIGAASTNDLTAHTTNTSNPHGVTATQVGAAPSNELTDHVTNTVPHVSDADRTNWNGKATLVDVAGVGYLINETYLGTITGGTIVTGAVAGVTTNGGRLDFTVPSGGGVTDLSGWSTNPATSMITWEDTSVTNLTLSCTNANPDVTGVYTQITDVHGFPRWGANGYYVWAYETGPYMIGTNGSGSVPGESGWGRTGSGSVTGIYDPLNGVVGVITVTYSHPLWQAGFNGTNWTITRDGVVLFDATNAATFQAQLNSKLGTNGNGTGLSGVWHPGESVTNAVDESARAANTATSNAIPTTAEQVGAYPDANGIVSSNLAYTASTNAEAARVIATNAQAVANAALPASSTNSLAVTALQVTGGGPTNGAVVGATNSLGQLGYIVYPKIHVQKTDRMLISGGGWVNPLFNSVQYQVGGSWNNTNGWTPGIIGWTTINCSVNILNSYTGIFAAELLCNGVRFMDSLSQNEGASTPTIFGTFSFPNLNATNVYLVKVLLLSAGSYTNDNYFAVTYFTGNVSP